MTFIKKFIKHDIYHFIKTVFLIQICISIVLNIVTYIYIITHNFIILKHTQKHIMQENK